jgi:hypothetical protein
VTEARHRGLLARALHEVQVWSKSVSEEGHFTLQADTFSRSYLASYCKGVAEISDRVLCTDRLQAMYIWSRSASKVGHLTLEAGTVFPPCHSSHCREATESARCALPPRGLQTM